MAMSRESWVSGPAYRNRIIGPARTLWSVGLVEACGLARRDLSLGGRVLSQSIVLCAVFVAPVGVRGGNVL